MEVSVEEIIRLKTRLAEINRVPFDELVFTKDGKPLVFTQEEREEWKFMGLNNVDFIWLPHLDKQEEPVL